MSTIPSTAAPEGIHAEAVTAWFGRHVPAARPPLGFALVEAGHSNMTFVVSDTRRQRWVLRRPPLHTVLATAHDMNREHRAIAALHPVGFPVPRPLGFCSDPGVNGAPFYVMDYVDGLVIRDADEARSALDVATRRRISRSLVDVLAQLHAVDIDAVGLGDLGRREGYVARQLRRWLRQVDDTRDVDRPELHDVHDHLVTRIPEQDTTGIVHGDYRLDNCIIGPDGEVRAVLDWELCTLGDVLADVAMLLTYWSEPGERVTGPGQPTDRHRGLLLAGRVAGGVRGCLRTLARADRLLPGLGRLAPGVHPRRRAGALRGRRHGRQGAPRRHREFRRAASTASSPGHGTTPPGCPEGPSTARRTRENRSRPCE